MDTKTYPGKGLSLSQLVFALNEELKRTAYSPSCVRSLRLRLRDVDFPYRFTLDAILELNRDTSAALATIREWINSFAPINRVSMDVLSLIPTHLPSQNDRFRASFVCRYWRRAFLHHAGLWTHLCLSKGEVYVKTLLERAKGSPLTILVSGTDPAMTLLHPYTKQITSLEFANSEWTDIRLFSDSGPLPFLRTLNINALQIDPDGPDVTIVTPPSRPLFNGAVELKEFCLHSEGSPLLSHFVFPNLTSFELFVAPVEEEFRSSQLLDFLEASPMLQVVRIKIVTTISLEGVHHGRIVTLRNVENLSLATSDGELGYKLATHISCPSVKHTSLTHMCEEELDDDGLLEAFPALDSLNAIVRQYTTSPIEEVTFEIDPMSVNFTSCSLTLQPANTTVIELHFEVANDDDDDDPESFTCDVFSEASRAVRDLPLLTNIKRLHIHGLTFIADGSFTHIANEFGGLLKSLGPLEELTISDCKIQPFFLPFLHYPKIVGYPPIRVLKFSNPRDAFFECVAVGLLNLAKAQHELGVPFERVSAHWFCPNWRIGERLKHWVEGGITRVGEDPSTIPAAFYVGEGVGLRCESGVIEHVVGVGQAVTRRFTIYIFR